MATIIPLVNLGRERPAALPTQPTDIVAASPQHHELDERTRASDLLQRLAGPKASELPATAGRAAARMESLLAEGPSAMDTSHIAPAAAVDTARQLLATATAALELISEEAEVLGEALSSDLGGLHLDTLQEVADAVLALSMAPRSAPSWADPSAAAAAQVVLQAAAQDLRDAALLHRELYERFVESVWNIPVALLQAGRHRWRFILRGRLRRQLRAASRTGRVGSVASAAQEVLAVRASREQLAAVAPLLSHHLEQLDRGPLSDVDAALGALGAVQLLQATLDDQLNTERLFHLLLADAFRSPDVAGPAVNLRSALQAWTADVEAHGGAQPDGFDLHELADWIDECHDLLPALAEAAEAATRLGVSAPTLGALVEILLVREHVEELAPARQSVESQHQAGSAS